MVALHSKVPCTVPRTRRGEVVTVPHARNPNAATPLCGRRPPFRARDRPHRPRQARHAGGARHKGGSR